MTKKELIEAVIEGKKVDRIPYAIWSHMPDCDRDVEAIVNRTYEFFKTYDVDIVKTMNNGMYSVEDFGCEIDFSDVPKGGVAKIVSTPIVVGEDWNKVKEISIDEGALKREQTYLAKLLEKLEGEEVPVVFTVFSPITTANKMCGGRIIEFIEAGYAKEVHAALKEITKTTAKLAKRVIEMGADGIFLASQMSTYANSTEAFYEEFGAPYDCEVFEASNGWCNILHAHGADIMFDVLKKYPVQIFNWHAWESLPSVGEVFDLTDKAIMGGIERMDITNGNKNKLRYQIYETIKASRGKRLILAPGCVIRYPLNAEMLSYVKEVKEEVENMLVF